MGMAPKLPVNTGGANAIGVFIETAWLLGGCNKNYKLMAIINVY